MTHSESRRLYLSRINHVVTFISANLEEKLSLDTLAKEAYFSPFHFHRIFSSIVGETPNAYVNRLRVERAAVLLRRNRSRSVTDIAFSCGFSSSAAFSRSFKQYFGISATTWRKESAGNIGESVKSTPPGIRKDAGTLLLPEEQIRHLLQHVSLQRMPGFHVAYVANLEGYELEHICHAWNRLYTWAEARELLSPEATTIGMSFDDPDITPVHKCRYYACITVPDHITPDRTVGIMDIPPSRCAVYHFEGPPEQIQAAYKAFYAHWLPGSGFQPADQACFEICRATPNTHPQGFYVLDIHLPVVPL